MANPPTDIEPSELFLKLCEPRPSEEVDFPRKDRLGNPVGKIRIRVLTMEDHNRARITAQQALKRSVAGFGIQALDKSDMDSPAVREVLGDLVAHEILCMACLNHKPSFEETDDRPAVYGRVFNTPEDLRRVLTADETLTLFRAYQLVQHKWGPFELTTGDDAEVDAWVKRLEEGARLFPLLALSLPQLHELTSSLAARISSLSRILGSHWESLPPSLASLLEPYCLGTGSYGELAESSTQESTASSPEDVLVTIEQAAAWAEADKNANVPEE